MRIVVRLLDERKLLALRLIETALYGVRFLELLKSEDQKLRVVLVVQGTIRTQISNANQHTAS